MFLFLVCFMIVPSWFIILEANYFKDLKPNNDL